ncbi:Histone-lysine N-methyltransferase [Phytophthora citrophthora]|uniref:Histone-lysine N-methyltransferase n=1 Tax=Phytophthora citrophthora TaxID=4793 RepID=A0AAD9LEW6_9STRA|nr:Histone-lysine N-methyltransferase [Phytophthora citrophthora]
MKRKNNPWTKKRVREALKSLPAKLEERSKQPACVITEAFGQDVEPEITGREQEEVSKSGTVAWPVQVTHSLKLKIKDGVAIKDSWPTDRCSCIANCFPDTCMNAATKLFCAADNCIFQGHSQMEFTSPISAIDIGVRATEDIPVGATIAPYTGLLTDHNFDKDIRQWDCVISLQTKGRGNKKLFIDAEERGTVARFINHSCDPNTLFLEMRHNRDVHVMVKTTTKIAAGEEITVD